MSGASYDPYTVHPMEQCPVHPMGACPVHPIEACPVHPMRAGRSYGLKFVTYLFSYKSTLRRAPPAKTSKLENMSHNAVALNSGT